jgi:glycine/D-amino acid oxidase-like deaminating enzyme
VKVALVEAAQVGRGNTGAVAGWIAEDPGVAFVDLEKALGLRDARRAWQAWRRAALDFAALLRRLDVKCHLNARAIAADVALDAAAGLRGKDGATIDPYRACLGLAAAAAHRGASLFERSPVRKIRFSRKSVDVLTEGGSIRADRVVVATGMPTPLFKSLARHFWFRTTYLALTEAVPAKIRQQLGRRAAVLRDAAEPPHVVRWVGDDRVLVSGADGEAPASRLRSKTILQRTGQLMYELSTMYPDISGIRPEYGWAADYARSATGLPCIGPHRNYPWHLFAFGDLSYSVTGAYLASRVLLRHYFEEMDPADALFGFNR